MVPISGIKKESRLVRPITAFKGGQGKKQQHMERERSTDIKASNVADATIPGSPQPYRAVVMGIEAWVDVETFYDALRAHTAERGVLNALLVLVRPARPPSPSPSPSVAGLHEDTRSKSRGSCSRGGAPSERSRPRRERLINSGLALVDFSSQQAAEAAMRIPFYILGRRVRWRGMGSLPASEVPVAVAASSGDLPSPAMSNDALGSSPSNSTPPNVTQHRLAGLVGFKRYREEVLHRRCGPPRQVTPDQAM